MSAVAILSGRQSFIFRLVGLEEGVGEVGERDLSMIRICEKKNIKRNMYMYRSDVL